MSNQNQAVDVFGNWNHVVTIGGDFIAGQKAEFFTPNLDAYHPPYMPCFELSEGLKNTLNQRHILILGGQPEIEKADVIRQIAWNLVSEKGLLGDHLDVLEWEQAADYSRLLSRIRQTEAQTIFILPDAIPRNLGFNIFRLSTLIKSHFIIASTELPSISWESLNDINKQYWFEFDVEKIYTPEWLAQFFCQQLAEVEESQIPNIFRSVHSPFDKLSEELLVIDLALRLRTPAYIKAFMQYLCDSPKDLRVTALTNLVDKAHKIQPALEHWFQNVLSSEEQTLVIGLTLLDGLIDDQFFAAFERIAFEAWKPRDPNFVFPDYQDLQALSSFYSLVKSESIGIKIQSRLPDQRKAMIRILWQSRRRQLLAALQVMVNMIRESVKNRSSDLYLYGTEARRQQIRHVLGETLSDISTVSESEVEGFLIQLAADAEHEVQAVAADALAHWTVENKDKKLKSIAARWQREDRLINWMNQVIKDRNPDDIANAHVYIRATLVQALAYASRYELRNKIPWDQVKLFSELGRDPQPLVRKRFQQYALPMIIPQHLKRVQSILHELVDVDDLIRFISSSLAQAYSIDPDQVVNLLNDWYKEGDRSRPKELIDREKLSFREKLLITVVLTYGSIDYNQGVGKLTVEEVFDLYHNLLAREPHALVRVAIIKAVSVLASKDFTRAKPKLSRLAAEIMIEERDELIETLKEIFLSQRIDLRDGDNDAQINGKTYAIWYEIDNYPSTQVEDMLYKWIVDNTNPAAQQIATQAFVVFARIFSPYEKFRLPKANNKNSSNTKLLPTPENGECQFDKNSYRKGSLWERAANVVIAPRNQQVRHIMDGVLPEMLLHHQRNTVIVDFLLIRWSQSNDPFLKDLALKLKNSLGLVEHRTIVLLILGFLVLVTTLASIKFVEIIMRLFAGW